MFENYGKRFLSFVMALVMVFSMVPVQVFAAETDESHEGHDHSHEGQDIVAETTAPVVPEVPGTSIPVQPEVPGTSIPVQPEGSDNTPPVETEAPVHVHSFTAGEVVDPTCGAIGYTVYSCACGAVENRDEVAATGEHTYVDVIVAPTADAQGYTEHTCSVCGDSYQDTYVDPVPAEETEETEAQETEPEVTEPEYPESWTEEMIEIQEFIEDEIYVYWLDYYEFQMPQQDKFASIVEAMIDEELEVPEELAAEWEAIHAELEDIVLNKMGDNERENAVMSVRMVEDLMDGYAEEGLLTEEQLEELALANLVHIDFAQMVLAQGVAVSLLPTSDYNFAQNKIRIQSSGSAAADKCIEYTDNSAKYGVKGGSAFTGGGSTNTITITNISGVPGIISFNYTSGELASYNGLSSASGTYTSSELANEAVITLKIKGNTGLLSTDDGWLELTDITFTPATRTISFAAADNGTYTVTGGGLNGATVPVSETSGYGTKYVLTATPAEGGYRLIGWYNGENLISSNNPYEHTLTDDVTITPKFEIPNYVITFKAPVGTGSYTIDGTAWTEEFSETDASFKLVASHAPQQKFLGWYDGDGNQLSTSLEFDYVVSGDGSVYPKFEDLPLYDITVVYDTNGGTVTGAGVDAGVEGLDSVLTAKPNSGWTFLGWTDTDGKIVSTDNPYTFTPTGDVTLKAVFAKDGGNPVFGVGALSSSKVNVTQLFDNWDAAMAAGSYVVLMNNATLPAGNYMVPSGKTLLIPYNTSNTLHTSEPGKLKNTEPEPYSKPTAFRTLTMLSGANITVEGAVSLSAQQFAGGMYAGAPTGPVSFIHMNDSSNITVMTGANLYVWGYVTGSGKVTVNTGGTVYEDFQVMNWRGGTAGTGMIQNKQRVFPLSQYYIQNVEVPMKLEAQSSIKGYMSVTISILGVQGMPIEFVGPNGMFNIESGYVIKDYDEATDRLILDAYNCEIAMQGIEASLSNYKINTSNFDLPINGNITMNINAGSTCTLEESIALLPGAQLNVAAGATCKVGAGKSIFIYDVDEWGNYAYQNLTKYAGQDGTVCPVIYAPGRTGAMFKMNSDAQVHIAGIVDASEGYVYNTQSGEGVTGEAGAVVYGRAANTAGVTYQATQDNTTISYSQIEIKSVLLKNGDGSSVNSALYENATYFEYVGTGTDGKWLISCGGTHNYTDSTKTRGEKSPATCTEQSVYYIQCGNSETCEVISEEHTVATGDLKAHSLTQIGYKAATCTDPGNTAYQQCSVCKQFFDMQGEKIEENSWIIPANGHEYDNTDDKYGGVKEPATCQAPAVHWDVCTVCKAQSDATDNATQSVGERAPHSFTTQDSGVMKTAATCTVLQQNYIKCDNCEETTQTQADQNTIGVGELKPHSFNEKASNELASDATCTAEARYYVQCDNCAATTKGTENAKTVSVEGFADHVFDSKPSTILASSATCFANATYYVQCENCDATTEGTENAKTVEIADSKLEHVFNNGSMFYNGKTEKAKDADCVNAATYYVWCDRGCGTSSNEHGGETVTSVLDADKATGHKYENAELYGDKKTAADCENAAVYYDICDVCLQQSETVTQKHGAPLGHSYELGLDSEKLAEEATCYSLQKNYVKCDRCEHHTTDKTVEVANTLKQHDFGNTASTTLATPASCEQAATYYVKCDNADCTATSQGTANAKTVAVGAPAGHKYESDEIYGDVKSPADCQNAAVHFDTCDKCGKQSDTVTQTVGDPKPHTYEKNLDSKVMAVAATCYSLQKNYVKCDNCNYYNNEKTVDVQGTLKPHNFGETPALDHEATCANCENAATYYVECDNAGCTATSEGTANAKTVASGNALGHAFNNMASAQQVTAATCTNAATYYVKCDRCNAVDQTKVVTSGDALGHLFEATGTASGVTASDKTCIAKETRYVICSRADCNVNSSVMEDEGKEPVVVEVGAEPTGHKFEVEGDVVVKNDCKTNTRAVWKGKCSVCQQQSDSEDDYIIAEDVEHGETQIIGRRPATCTEAETYVFGCTVCRTETHTATSGNPLGHNYTATFNWAEDGKSASVTLTCDQCEEGTEGHSLNETATVEQIASTAGDCQTNSSVTYKGTLTLDGKTYEEVKTVEGERGAHTHGVAVEENRVESTCTKAGSYDEVVYCSICKTHEISRTQKNLPLAEHTAGAAVEENRVESTCTVAGSYDEVVYCSVCKTHKISSTTKDLQLKEHNYGEPSFAWSDTDNSCTASYSCSVGGEVVKNNCVITTESTNATCTEPGTVTFIASILVGETTYRNEKVVSGVARGHNYTATFNWAEDGKSASVTLTCDQCEESTEGHSLNETATVEQIASTAGDCQTNSSVTYKGTLTLDGKTYEEVKTVEGERGAHTHGVAVEENRVESTCTKAGSYDEVVYCSVCKTHEISRTQKNLPLAEHTAGAAVEENRVESTCTVAGSYDEVVYCSVCKTHKISSTTKDLPLANHSYADKPVFKWATNGTGATTELDCLTCEDHALIGTASVSKVASTEGNCQTNKTTTYKAVVELNGQTYEEEKIVEGAKGDHDCEITIVDPTCLVDGYILMDCKLCDYSESLQTGETALGHDMAPATCTAPATCKRAGCGYTEGKKLPHSFTNKDSGNIASEANCVDPEMHYVQCDNCIEVSDTVKVAYGNAKGHSFNTKKSDQQASAANCTEAAKYYVQCDNCKEVTKAKTVSDGEATGHSFNSKASNQQASAANCTEAAKYYVQCDNCTAVATEKTVAVGEAKGHSFNTKKSDQLASAANCTEAAKYYVQCDNCTEDSTEKTVAYGNANGHKFNAKASQELAVEASCTAAARYYVQCDNCDAVTKEKTVAVGEPNEHAFNSKASNQQASAANCTEAAKYYVQCDNCTAVTTEKTVAVGEAKGHSFNARKSDKLASAANCTEAAQYYVQCDNCDEVSTEKTVAYGNANGHKFNAKASQELAVEASCTAAARYYVQCDNCDAVTKEKTVAVGEPNEHAFNSKASNQQASAANCTEAAQYYVQCDNCAAVTTEKTVAVGEAKGHSFNARKSDKLASAANCTEAAQYYVQCDNCDEVSTEKTVAYGKENGHKFNAKASQELAVEASCTAAARYYVQCDNCDAVTKEKTVAVGEPNEHVFNSLASAKQATPADCENAATYYVKCDDCNAVSNEKTIAVGKANGHKFNSKASEEMATESSCTTAARYYVQCDNCEEVTKDKTVAVGEAKGHSFTTKDSGVVVTAALCEAKAVHKVQCDNCTAISDEVTVEIGEPLGHDMAPATCDLPSTCKNGCGKTEGEALGHNMSEPTCKEPATCQNGCGYTEGEALPHTWVEEEEIPPLCEEPGYTAGKRCSVCGQTEGIYKIAATGHMIMKVDAKKPTFGNPGWEAYERCVNCNYTTMVEIPALPVPSIETYDQFIESLIELEKLTAEYIQLNPAKDPLGLMIEYIRTGVDRYNSGSWNIMAGYEDPDYAKFISKREDEINAQFDNIEDMIKVTALKDIHEFILPNSDGVDFGHMFGTMDITYHNNFSENHADVAGWAGDLVDLLSTSDRHHVYTADENGNYPTIEEMVKEIGEKYLNHDIAGEDDQFGHSDMYGDLDGFYLMNTLKHQGYETGDLAKIMQSYFTTNLTDEYRAEYFLKNRLDGVSTRNAVRDAVYGEYVSNKVIATLEGTRDFVTDDIAQLRIACCYTFADYLCRLGGDYVEVPDNQYYTVFESDFSTLAPGITQEIKKATTADNKQIVYYIATADLNRSDVNVYANYNENDPTKGWKMARVQDQAQAAQDRYGNPDSTDYIENYNVITSINADGFNMSTGEPSGVLVMNGVEYHPVNANGFFGIMKDGRAVIGSTAYYNSVKDQVQEAVAGFGTMLVENGKIAISRTDNYYSDRASRTAVGITRSGKVVFMVLDGRQEPVSCGGSMQEIAQIMLEAGCYYAINLDGGGSTTYVAKPEGEDALRVVSKPSDGFARSVSTTLMMVSTAPSSTAFDHAMVESDFEYLTPNATIQVTAKGVSATGNEAEIPEGAYWAVDNTNKAVITEDGVLTGLSLGSVQVNLMLDGNILGSKQIHIVNPDAVYYTRETLNAVYGAETVLPVKAQYQGKPVAITTADVVFSLSNPAAGTVNGFTFVAEAGTGLKVVKITAALAADSTKTASISVSLYNQGEMSFDFDMATGGDRTIAWFRQVSNATTDDNSIYEVVKVGEPMVTSYTFALDMSQITMPEQLEDLTYMLPGADAADASAWNFLLQLAERVSVLTEVTAKVKFDPNFDVDYSQMKIVCEYFIMNDPATDIVFNTEENTLAITLHWKDQTQAIPPETADPLCLLSGIKLTPKEDAAWDTKDRLVPVHSGEISYNVFLRANALYTFASKEANQKEYGLKPFENPDVIIGGATEKGGSFADTYVTFQDSYTLINAVKNGWVGAEGGYMYYVDGEYYTSIQEVDGYYYDFGENGICIGQQKYNGLFEKNGKTYYARFGVLVKNDWMSVGDDRYRFDENGVGLDGTVKIDEVDLKFENGKLVGGYSGFVTKSDKKTYHYVDGVLTLGWYLMDGDWYHFDTGTGAMNTGTHVLPDAEAKSKGAYYDFAPDGKLVCGYFNNAGYYYWPDLIDSETDAHAGTGRPKIFQWVQSGSVADDWPANGATKDSWYYTNSHGHFATGGNSPAVYDYVVDGVTHKAIDIEVNNRVYTFDNDHGYLLRGFFSYENNNWFYYWVDETVNDGWFDVDGETYYAYANGHLAVGSHVIDGEPYMFNERGMLIKDGLSLLVTVNADNTLMTITTSETEGLSNVRMAVWSEASNQEDLRWFEATVNENGQWSANVPLCLYEKTGTYQIHAYGVNADGADGLLVNTTTNVAKTAAHQKSEAVKENEIAPGCTTKGSYDLVIYCAVCSAEISRETVEIPAAHKPGPAVSENVVGAVCEVGGSYDKVIYCTECKTELSREKVDVPAGTHQPNDEVVENKVDATCTEDGSYDTVVYCIVCSEELSREKQVIKAEGHVAGETAVENKVAATCTTEGGYDNVVRCTVCNEIITSEHVTEEATGHVDEDENEKCDVCQKDLSEGDEEEKPERMETIPMLRLYNPNTGEHFYTGSEEERDMLVEAGWHYEGVAWNAPVKVGAPIYRLYNPNSGDHHYTGSEVERDYLVSLGWHYEGVAWNTLGETECPQYRMYNPNADVGSHHYTGSIEERDYLVSLGWHYEGIAWYGSLK